MTLEDFKVCYGIDSTVDVIEWIQRPTKTRQGRFKQETIDNHTKAFSSRSSYNI